MKASARTLAKRKVERELDALCREIVLQRDGWRCVRCGRANGEAIPGSVERVRLQWAHVITRRIRSTRWLLENGMSLCKGCHFGFWHRVSVRLNEWPEEAAQEWFAAKYPERRQALLVARGIGSSSGRAWRFDPHAIRLYLETERRKIMGGAT